jgi:hypothetical protein
MSNEAMIRYAFYIPKNSIKEIDQRRGRYMSRNKYLMKILEEHWTEEDQLTKYVEGLKVTSPTAPPPSPIPPSTPTNTGTSKVDSFETHANHLGTRRGSVDVNERS